MAFNFTLEMIYFREVKNNSSIIAELGLRIVEINLNLYQLKLIQTKNGGMFVASPSKEYKDPQTGEKKYSPYWLFNRKEGDEFQSMAKRLVEQHLALKQPEIKPLPQDDDMPF